MCIIQFSNRFNRFLQIKFHLFMHFLIIYYFHWTFSTVNDVTSTFDITVYDESLINENLGRISIPLLRIENDEKRWYALKDRSKKSNAKGNCPRILLQMSLVWNPVSITWLYFNTSTQGNKLVAHTADHVALPERPKRKHALAWHNCS